MRNKLNEGKKGNIKNYNFLYVCNCLCRFYLYSKLYRREYARSSDIMIVHDYVNQP